MTNLSKILLATALTAVFAAPAFAAEEGALQERSNYTLNGGAIPPAATESFASAPARAPIVRVAPPSGAAANEIDVHALTQRAQAGIGRF